MTKRKRRSQGRTGIQRPRRDGTGHVGSLMERLATIAGDRGIDTTKKLTREQAHDRRHQSDASEA